MTRPLKKIELDLKDTIENYFYEKTKDFVFNYYDEDEKKYELNEMVKDCIDEVLYELNYAEKKIDNFLENYEMYRMEDLKEYEYKIKHREY